MDDEEPGLKAVKKAYRVYSEIGKTSMKKLFGSLSIKPRPKQWLKDLFSDKIRYGIFARKPSFLLSEKPDKEWGLKKSKKGKKKGRIKLPVKKRKKKSRKRLNRPWMMVMMRLK